LCLILEKEAKRKSVSTDGGLLPEFFFHRGLKKEPKKSPFLYVPNPLITSQSY
jgi:hypothetical protein